MKKVSFDVSLDTLISTIGEEDLKDIRFCKELIRRAFEEQNTKAIKLLFEKAGTVFIFGDEALRKDLIKHIYSIIRMSTFEKVIEIGKDSILGNVIALCYFIKKYGVIPSEKINILTMLSKLRFIKDPFMLELIPSKDQIIINLDERVEELYKPDEIKESAETCEWLFVNGLVVQSKDTISGMCILYENSPSSSPELRFKGNLVSSLLNKKLDLFLHSVKKIYGKDIKNEIELMANYTEIYDLLLKISTPVFFDFNNIRFNNVLYNDNFYFLKFLNKNGTEKLLFPFEQIELDKVQKVYDPNTEKYVTPKGRLGKVQLHEIFSFRKVQEVSEVPGKKIKLVKELYETGIEEKIRDILKDQNITPHGPAERADIFTTKLFINNENDLRNAAFIIKGRGYPRVYLDSIALNILKAVDLPVNIILLVYTGSILDEAQEKFIKQCDLNMKMYCIIDSRDLTRLLVAYNKW